MKKRIFIAISLPKDIATALNREIDGLRDVLLAADLPAYRFITPKNWHLTISFLGEQEDYSMPAIIDSVRAISRQFSRPMIKFEKIIYGPPGKSPRMIWALGAKTTSEELGEIKAHLDDDLVEGGVRFPQEERLYTSHLTLAKFESTIKSGLPKIEKDINLEFEGESLEIMESRLGRKGAEYESLARFPFVE